MFQNLILEFYVLIFNPQSYINVVPPFVIASANFMFQNLILEFYVLKFNPKSYINVVPPFVIAQC